MPIKKKSQVGEKVQDEERDAEVELAVLFRALGDPTRLRLYRFLRARCGPVAVEDGEELWMRVGPTVGEVCCAVADSKKITALVSHHLKEMRVAGLIAVKRRGKNMICGVRREAAITLEQFFGAEGLETEKLKTEALETVNEKDGLWAEDSSLATELN